MLIKEFYSGATKIKIYDDYLPKTPEENRIRKENLDDVMRRINERTAREEEEKLQKIAEG